MTRLSLAGRPTCHALLIGLIVILSSVGIAGCGRPKATSATTGYAPAEAEAKPSPTHEREEAPWSGQAAKNESRSAVAPPPDAPPGDWAFEIPTPDIEIALVQSDVRKILVAVYNGDVDTAIEFSHPKALELLGGKSQARTILGLVLKQLATIGMRVESVELPNEPTFLKTEVREYVVVPTKLVIAANNGRIESLNYQFGSREIGSGRWKYIEGSRINQDNVRVFFPDFPAGFDFPHVYRQKL